MPLQDLLEQVLPQLPVTLDQREISRAEPQIEWGFARPLEPRSAQFDDGRLLWFRVHDM